MIVKFCPYHEICNIKKVVFFKGIKKWKLYNLIFRNKRNKTLKNFVLIDITCLFLLVINFC